jgi:hypothetical protein
MTHQPRPTGRASSGSGSSSGDGGGDGDGGEEQSTEGRHTELDAAAEAAADRHRAVDAELAEADHESGGDAERLWQKCRAAGKEMMAARKAAKKWREQTSGESTAKKRSRTKRQEQQEQRQRES